MTPPTVAATVVLLASLLAACSSKPEHVSHPTVGMLKLEQPKDGWTGADKSKRDLVVHALNGQRTSDPSIRGGMLLPPGWQQITFSAQGHNASALAARYGNGSGSELSGRMDAAASAKFDRTISINVQPDHDYMASMKKHKDHYDFTVEDVGTGRVVGRSKE